MTVVDRCRRNPCPECEEAANMIETLAPFLAVWAAQYQKDFELNGLHPIHFDLLERCGVRMADFKRATNAQPTRAAMESVLGADP